MRTMWGRALLVALFLLMPAATSFSAPQTVTPGPIRVGDRASYIVSAGDPPTSESLTLTALPGVHSCKDGFARTFTCARFALDYAFLSPPSANFTAPVVVSLAHAEAVAWGTWDLAGTAETQMYASPTYWWAGNPQFSPSGNSMNTLRVILVGAIGLSTRAHLDGEGPATLAGAPGILEIDTTPSGATIVTATFATSTIPIAYISTFYDGESLPSAISVVRNGSLIGQATRTAFTMGSSTIPFSANPSPLDFPSVRPGLTPQTWSKFPPGSSDFYYSLGKAWHEARLLPNAALYHLDHPDAYLVDASYDEDLGRTIAQGVPNDALAHWWLTRGDETLEVQETIMTRRGLASDRRLGVDTPNEFASGPAPEWWKVIPPRSALPNEIITLDDAKQVGQQYAPYDPEQFSFQWRVDPRAEAADTDVAAIYIVHCGTVLGGHPLIVVFLSAITGQVLGRQNQGATECAGE